MKDRPLSQWTAGERVRFYAKNIRSYLGDNYSHLRSQKLDNSAMLTARLLEAHDQNREYQLKAAGQMR